MPHYSYISEDDTMMYNKWVQGIASRDLKGNNILLSNLKQQQNSQNYTNSDVGAPDIKLPKTLPFPLATIYDDLAGFLVLYGNIIEKLKRASDNPITNVKDKRKYSQIITEFEKIQTIIRGGVNMFDKQVD